MLRAAVETDLLAVDDLKAKLGRDHEVIPKRSERFAQEVFIREGPIHLSRVKKSDSAFDRRMQQLDAFLSRRRRAIRSAQTHAAKPDRRNLKTARTQLSLVHSRLTPKYVTARWT